MQTYLKILQSWWFPALYMVIIGADLIGHIGVLTTIFDTQLPTTINFIQFALIALTCINYAFLMEPATPEHFQKLAPFVQKAQPVLLISFTVLNLGLIIFTIITL